ncbi:hypothetical protein JTB14_000691 [Gonioctena quinquepunctata]|nr:hypothetical protein JTB14_000691 [Gonioctena quinquepunctata]
MPPTWKEWSFNTASAGTASRNGGRGHKLEMNLRISPLPVRKVATRGIPSEPFGNPTELPLRRSKPGHQLQAGTCFLSIFVGLGVPRPDLTVFGRCVVAVVEAFRRTIYSDVHEVFRIDVRERPIGK